MNHPDGPYLVQAPNISSVIESNTQNILSVFSAQFPMAQQAREKGRVQSLLRVTEAQVQKIKEAIMSCKRPGDVELFTGSELEKGADLSQVHLYGFLGNMLYCGPEYNSLATFRFTQKGERTVILLNFSSLWGMLSPEQRQFKLEPNYNITH